MQIYLSECNELYQNRNLIPHTNTKTQFIIR